jgi:hypothetical protein
LNWWKIQYNKNVMLSILSSAQKSLNIWRYTCGPNSFHWHHFTSLQFVLQTSKNELKTQKSIRYDHGIFNNMWLSLKNLHICLIQKPFLYIRKMVFFLGELSPFFEIVKRAKKMHLKIYGNIFHKFAPKSPWP